MPRIGRDSQRSAVYEWEQRIPECAAMKKQPKMSLLEVRELVKRVWADWVGNVVPPPRVGAGRANRGRGIAREYRQIEMPEWTRMPWYVLHEIAHCIVSFRGHKGEPGHGPRWARVYLDLLGQYAGVDVGRAREMAKRVPTSVSRSYATGGAPKQNYRRVRFAGDAERIESYSCRRLRRKLKENNR